MKKLFSSLFIFFLTISSSFAQTSFFGGLNVAGSTNVGFWGLNPTAEVEQKIFGNLNADFRLNGFVDLGPNENIPGVNTKDYHRSIYSDLGLNFKLIDRKVDWSIGAGGSYRIGTEKFVDEVGYNGNTLVHYDTRKINFSGFGIFVKNTIGFGKNVSLNLTVYRFNFWGEYMSVGPSFKIN
ncbi:hypothetical protein [Fodinibius sp.]|uniref:hypothetical protein n=1 Tax=Fodinibius sp. TaxID=1872440 RepID=UPI002ACD3FBE|nr:hypothetical protein [Fodinibius sp.]MDZ7659489.1 hypothetical protein [Fodinibius sp.]